MEEIMQKNIDKDKIEQAVKMILEAIGEDPGREGLLNTPEELPVCTPKFFPVWKKIPAINCRYPSLNTMMNGPGQRYTYLLYVRTSSAALLRHCPYCLYPKGGKVVGISKLARVAEVYCKRPQLQERLTSQIADCINDTLNPWGVGVVISAEHMCMTMRGVRKPGSVTVTSAVEVSLKAKHQPEPNFIP
jgi:GTP cyclohydrolase I